MGLREGRGDPGLPVGAARMGRGREGRVGGGDIYALTTIDVEARACSRGGGNGVERGSNFSVG